jgi:hypothetical protein
VQRPHTSLWDTSPRCASSSPSTRPVGGRRLARVDDAASRQRPARVDERGRRRRPVVGPPRRGVAEPLPPQQRDAELHRSCAAPSQSLDPQQPLEVLELEQGRQLGVRHDRGERLVGSGQPQRTQLAEHVVQRGVREVDVEDRSADVGRQPGLVQCERLRARVPQALESDQLGISGQFQPGRDLRVVGEPEEPDLGALLQPGLLDGPEQAVQATERLREDTLVEEAPTPTVPVDQSPRSQPLHGLAHRMPAHAVVLRELLVGREPVDDVARRDASLQVVEHLLPQRTARWRSLRLRHDRLPGPGPPPPGRR